MMPKYLKLVLMVAGCLLIGAAGSLFTVSAIPIWYVHLVKPSFSPPNYLFAPVWTILYIFMGISIFLISEKGTKTKRIREAVYLFITQLILNAIWTPIFFGARNILLGLMVIVLMWLFILKTILAFGKINKTASYLLYPYLAWVSFATILNFSVWILNR